MVDSPVNSFKTHSNYIRAFATLVCSDIQPIPNQIYHHISDRILQSGCLLSRPRTKVSDTEVLSSLKNAWGTELLIDMGKLYVNEPELCKLSNNWNVVQLYYVLYHVTQAVVLANGFPRPTSHTKTQHHFFDLWASRNKCLEPWTISFDAQGARNIPSHINVDDKKHQWTHCSPDNAWSLACKALKTTRNEKLEASRKSAREDKRRERKKLLSQRLANQNVKIRGNISLPIIPLPRLTLDEKLSINENAPPTTIIDYFWRLRIKTNYKDSAMFTDGCIDNNLALQVRNDLSILASSTLLLAELTISNILGSITFDKWINDWAHTNVPSNVISGIRHRLTLYASDGRHYC